MASAVFRPKLSEASWYKRIKSTRSKILNPKPKSTKNIINSQSSSFDSYSTTQSFVNQIDSKNLGQKRAGPDDDVRENKRRRCLVPNNPNPNPRRREMRQDEREHVGLLLKAFADKYSDEIAQIVAKRNPTLIIPGEDGEVELDTEVIDSEIMWDLYCFLKLKLMAEHSNKGILLLPRQLAHLLLLLLLSQLHHFHLFPPFFPSTGTQKAKMEGAHIQAEAVVSDTKKYQDDLQKLGLRIKQHEDNIKFLRTQKNDIDDSILNLQGTIGKSHASMQLVSEDE